MRKIYILVGALFICCACYGQQNLIEYKKIAETEIQKYFEFPLVKTKCIVKSKTGTDGREGFFTNNYIIEENDNESFIKITLEYSIFSNEINDWFSVLITIDSNKIRDYSKTDFKQIPSCISKNKECGFIKSEAAIAIAIKDSILYSDNLKTSFWVDDKSGRCFWTVKGLPKTKSLTGSGKQYRRIDALTGEIIK